jgi:hypothetical protein
LSWTGLNWTAEHPRFVIDVTGDGRADIVGFGDDGVWTALNNGSGAFHTPPNRAPTRVEPDMRHPTPSAL